MYKKRNYPRDPYWTKARFVSHCRKCEIEIKKGNKIFYYPNTKSVYCETCGQSASADFACCLQDEEFFTSQY